MAVSHMKLAHLDEARLERLRALEDDLGLHILALEPEVRLADLTAGDSSAVPAPLAAAPGPSALSGLVRREALDQVGDCLAELREDYRQVILLRDVEGASWKEIAARLGAPSPDAARMLRGQALARLCVLVSRRRGRRR